MTVPGRRVRLQRFLAMAGMASRREAERWIAEGVVRVNGRQAALGETVDPAADKVTVEGKQVRGPRAPVYLAMNKPREVLCTREDPKGRRTVMSLVGRSAGLVAPVGRLDYHSSGLLLLTNDGDLAHRLTRPASGVAKVYRVKAARPLEHEEARRLRDGIPLDGRKTLTARLAAVADRTGFWYQMELTEGRNRQVRRMFEAVGNRVQKLTRVAIGPIGLGKLASGEVRELTSLEVEKLKASVGLGPPPRAASRRKPGWALPKKRPPGRQSRNRSGASSRPPEKRRRARKEK